MRVIKNNYGQPATGGHSYAVLARACHNTGQLQLIHHHSHLTTPFLICNSRDIGSVSKMSNSVHIANAYRLAVAVVIKHNRTSYIRLVCSQGDSLGAEELPLK